jgi:hypothetical protein
MKTTRWWLVVALVLLLVPAVGATDDEEYEPPQDESEVEITTGYRGSSTDGALFRVAEYEITDPGAIVGLGWMTSPYEANVFKLNFLSNDSADFTASADFDMNRSLRVKASADGLLHRLGHDPISNMEAVSDIKVVRSTDFEPGADYAIKHQRFDALATFAPPEAGWLTFRVGFREENRKGTRQQLAASHCTGCHVTSQGRDVDQQTRDYTFGIHGTTGGFDADYELLSRRFDENAGTITAPYEEAFRPATPGSAADPTVLIKPFNDRLWFQNGDYAVNQIPQIQRMAHKLKLRGQIGEKNSVNFTLLRSSTENRTSNLEYEFTGARGNYVWRAKDNLKLNFWAHWDKIENKNYFIDLLALNNLTAAPIGSYPGNPGVTFQWWVNNVTVPARPPGYGLDQPQEFTQYDRLSPLDREESRLGVDARWRLDPKNNLRIGYRYQDVDRDYVTLADGSGKTTSHLLKLNHNYRATKHLRWNTNLRYQITDNPYVNVDGGLRAYYPDVPGTSPGPPNGAGPRGTGSLQYWELQQLRVANLGNFATKALKFRTQATWSPSRNWALGGNVRYRDAENDELDYSQWDSNLAGIGVNFWYAFNSAFNLTVGLDSMMQETNTVFAVPLMDG